MGTKLFVELGTNEFLLYLPPPPPKKLNQP